jgi:hypothetical protein
VVTRNVDPLCPESTSSHFAMRNFSELPWLRLFGILRQFDPFFGDLKPIILVGLAYRLLRLLAAFRGELAESHRVFLRHQMRILHENQIRPTAACKLRALRASERGHEIS